MADARVAYLAVVAPRIHNFRGTKRREAGLTPGTVSLAPVGLLVRLWMMTNALAGLESR